MENTSNVVKFRYTISMVFTSPKYLYSETKCNLNKKFFYLEEKKLDVKKSLLEIFLGFKKIMDVLA